MPSIGPLAAQALPFRSGLQDLHPQGESFPESGIVAPGPLTVSPHVQAENTGLRGFPEKPPDAIGNPGRVHPPAPGAPTLGEDQDIPPLPEEMEALLQHGPHVLTVPAPPDGDALGEIAEGSQKA